MCFKISVMKIFLYSEIVMFELVEINFSFEQFKLTNKTIAFDFFCHIYYPTNSYWFFVPDIESCPFLTTPIRVIFIGLLTPLIP